MVEGPSTLLLSGEMYLSDGEIAEAESCLAAAAEMASGSMHPSLRKQFNELKDGIAAAKAAQPSA